MLTHAAKKEGPPVQEDGGAFDPDFPKTHPIDDAVRAVGNHYVVQARMLRAPQLRLGVNGDRADAVAYRNRCFDAEFPYLHERFTVLARAAERHRHAYRTKRSVGNQLHHRTFDVPFRQPHQVHVAMNAAVVEPIRVTHGHAIAAALVFHVHDDAVVLLDRCAGIHAERRRSTVVGTEAGAV